MKKKDVNHLTRSELINLVYQMDKSNTGLNTSVSEQIKQERRKIRQKKAIQKFSTVIQALKHIMDRKELALRNIVGKTKMLRNMLTQR